MTGSPGHPAEIDHYLFAGRRDWSAPFRALVAGGGTGDGTIMLAQLLADRGTPADIVYLDVSVAARRIAEARAAARGLTNIRFLTGSLLEAVTLGPFDYVDACGVLHHLDDPEAGLRALADATAPDGGLGLMVYGALGRTGVYPVQAALRLLAPAGDMGDADRVALARRLVQNLPPTNWLRRNPFLGDHRNGDAEIFDLLLHSRDRAYLVPELLALVASAGLRAVAFIEPARYQPATYLTDAALLRRAAGLPAEARAALAESLSGAIKTHAIYAVPAARADEPVAVLRDEAVLVWREGGGSVWAQRLAPGAALIADFDGVKFRTPLPPLAPAILARVDGHRTVAEIRDALPAGADRKVADAQIAETVAALVALNKLLIGSRARTG